MWQFASFHYKMGKNKFILHPAFSAEFIVLKRIFVKGKLSTVI